MGSNGCQSLPDPPKYDECVVLTELNARCFPKNNPGGKEYDLPKEELVGGFWVSPESHAARAKYIAELEEIIESRQDGNASE